MINEKAMAAELERMVKKSGYNVTRYEQSLMIETETWTAVFPEDGIPGKILGKLAEHFGRIPQEETSWTVTKDGVQSMIHETQAQELCQILRQAEDEESREIRLTGLKWFNFVLWQDEKLRIKAVRESQMKLLDYGRSVCGVYSETLDGVILTGEAVILLRRIAVSEELDARLSRDQWGVE